ncbi:MAG: metal ABC transporter ATP-binding protein [Bacteroidota bacterium]|nr:metal ABC transporter ATP-binding protein [Bacteroidota bacterium]MDP2113705.1 metal ABC transporter ATP-binding protein [Bacteroidota bacterium]MDP3435306.1 metal ABC transporter ATP-binding protein [Bacteroidota bacterium]
MKKLLEIKNLSAGYENQVVLENVTLDIFSNDFIGVIGPNGGGKTTLIKTILGLIKPISGELNLLINKKNIGYLPQVNQIDKRFPITVFDVVRSGKADTALFSSFQKNRQEKEKAESLLREMGISNLRNKSIGELSGGQMQRVFLCRALMNEPELLVLDEPSTYVDNNFEGELYLKLKELNDRMAILLISHDVGTISFFVKTIACVNRNLHHHPSNIISEEQLASYNCPLQIITHGDIPHTVLKLHDEHEHHGHHH